MKATFTIAAVLCAYMLVQSAVALPLSAESAESFEIAHHKPGKHGQLKQKIPPITIDAKMKATAHVTVPEEVVEAITKLVFKLQEEHKLHEGKLGKHHQPKRHEKPMSAEEPAQGDEPEKVKHHQHKRHEKPMSAEEPAQGDEPEKVEQPAEVPEKVEQPAEEPEKVEQPAEVPEKVEQPAEEPEKVEQPAEEPEKVEQPAEEPEKEEQ